MSLAPVVRAVTVRAPAERAFAVFTERIGDWWPLADYSLAAARATTVAFIDGSLVETDVDGGTVIWGSLTEWDPPRRLCFTWAPEGGPETSVAVDFEPADGETRVVLTHEGWEAFGDDAPKRRANYDNDRAWGWILGLFALAADAVIESVVQKADAGERAYDVAALRSGYAGVALALEPGRFSEPPAGEWNARQVAGHVITNAELLSKALDDVRRRQPARLHGPDDHTPAAIGRCDGLTLDDTAGEVRRAGAELVARCSGLTPGDLSTAVSTHIEHDGQVIVDGEMTVGDLLAAQVHYHLPAHVGQIGDLAL